MASIYLFKKFTNHCFKYFILSFALISCREAKSQVTNRSSKPISREFKNAGEQEDFWAEELFKRDYRTEHYKRYKYPIVLSGNYYDYKNVVIAVGPIPALRAIFDKGIFYPGVISRATKYKHNPQIQINMDSLLAWNKRDPTGSGKHSHHVFPKIDSLWITDFEEMKFLEKTSTLKRFRFWLFRKGFANPTVYFMELTNKNATAETDIVLFISGAKLTFFDEGWVII